MYTCYECGKTIKGPIKQCGVVSIARMTGFNYATNKPCDLDFAKAYHQACYDKLEAKAAEFLQRGTK